MQPSQSILARALASGTIAGMTSALASALTGKRETASYAAPLNATSHVFWGDEAARQNDVSAKYTGTGFLLNHASAIFWAAIYEKWFARKADNIFGSKSPLTPLIGAAAVTAGAYVTDYYFVPKRFTPGYEKRLSGSSMAIIYGALALGLVAGAMIFDRD